MQGTGSMSALAPRSLVHESAEFCGELVRRSRHVLTFPFIGLRLVVSVEREAKARPVRQALLSPEFTDVELARFAARSGAPIERAWERGLALQYGGTQRL